MNNNQFVFHKETLPQVATVLTSLNKSRERVRLFYGDVDNGKSWLDEHNMVGTIGKSTGIKPIPLIISNNRSMCGVALLAHCIIGIKTVAGQWLYKHPTFNTGKLKIIAFDRHSTRHDPIDLLCTVERDGKPLASFKTIKRAENYISFMNGDRMRGW